MYLAYNPITKEQNDDAAADVFTHPGPCPQCGEDAPCYEDRTGECYCLPCLTEAVREETEKVNAQEFDNLYLLQAQQAREMATSFAYAEPFC